jgi:hypothetical protein
MLKILCEIKKYKYVFHREKLYKNISTTQKIFTTLNREVFGGLIFVLLCLFFIMRKNERSKQDNIKLISTTNIQ